MVDGDVHGSMQDRKKSGLGGGAGVRFRQVEHNIGALPAQTPRQLFNIGVREKSELEI